MDSSLDKAVFLANDTMARCVAALEKEKSANQNLRQVDQAARDIYQKQVVKMIAALSLLLRKDFSAVPTKPEESEEMTIESICIIDGNKVNDIRRPNATPAPVARSDMPTLSDDERPGYISKCADLLRSLELDCFLPEPGGSRDPLDFCIPLRALCTWQTNFLATTPDHVALAKIQVNWRTSLASFTLVSKESIAASKTLTSHIDAIDRAYERERMKARAAEEKKALKEQQQIVKEHRPKCDHL